MDKKPDCYKCKYREKIPGDAHSRCVYPGNDTDIFSFFASGNIENIKKLNIKGHLTGVERGCFMWPVNFDPTWLLNCDGYKEK